MTSEQKKQIKKMREKLCTYAEIATSLGLSSNSVKSYCLRNNLNTEALKQNAKLCKNCGTPLCSRQKQNHMYSAVKIASLPGGRSTKPSITATLFGIILVLLAARHSAIITVRKECTARKSVIKREIQMERTEFYKDLTSYKTSLKQAKTMLERGLISADDYAKIDTKLAQKYGINSCSIYAQNNWIYSLYPRF